MLKRLIRLIQQAKQNGTHLNTFCFKQNAKKGALRGLIFKLWRRIFITPVQKIITVTPDPKVSGIYNVVDNSNNLKYATLDRIIKNWCTFDAIERAATKANFKIVVLG